MMEELKFEMGFNTHGVRVTKLDTGEIRCWKFNNTKYDYEVFTDIDSAIDYITTPMPSLGWHIEINEIEE
jgi:hypothetical protein